MKYWDDEHIYDNEGRKVRVKVLLPTRSVFQFFISQGKVKIVNHGFPHINKFLKAIKKIPSENQMFFRFVCYKKGVV